MAQTSFNETNLAQLLPVGKLPAELLARLLAQAPTQDPQVLLGPGIGLDCAVLDLSSTLLVLKSDPITFATDKIGWYAVQVNANDIATSGAVPRWMLATLLLPEGQTTAEMVEDIGQQLYAACRETGITLVGGHTEITYGLDRPILIGTMIGEVSRAGLVTPRGAQMGDRLLLTKGVPIEATAILAREFPEKLSCSGIQPDSSERLSQNELRLAQDFLHTPGISVLREARLAVQAGQVHAMHDPTEGGLYTALWELAEASGHSLAVDLRTAPIPALSARICHLLDLDPFAAIASGALLLAASSDNAGCISRALQAEGILCTEIGQVLECCTPPVVWDQANTVPLPRPSRDAIAHLFE